MNKSNLVTVALLALPLLSAAPAAPAEAAQKAACGHVRSDFDGDGRSDVAAGSGGDHVPGDSQNRVGSVSIVYDPIGAGGSAKKQTIPGTIVPGTVDFGSGLASGYFDADCYADLVVGAAESGRVIVLRGSASGLTTTGAQTFEPSAVPGGGDRWDFGSAVAAGDFNNDGFDDIAVGSSGLTSGGPDADDGGATGILYGSAGGVTAAAGRWIKEGADGVPGVSSPRDGMGSALVAGDFDGDGFDDLAIGAPGERDGAGGDGSGGAGAVVVVRGSATGVTSAASRYLDQSSPGVPGDLELGDNFGSALAAGDLTGDGRADLVIGSPGEALGTIDRAGSVTILKGSASGVNGTGSVRFDQDTAGIPGAAEPYDWFGAAVAIVDLDGNGQLDLAVGTPNEDVDSVSNTGSVTAIYGTTGGLTATGSRFVDQNSAGIPGANETNDGFSYALSAIPGALVVGSPGEEVTSGSIYNGAFDVLTGNLSVGSFFGPAQFPRVTTGDGALGSTLS